MSVRRGTKSAENSRDQSVRSAFPAKEVSERESLGRSRGSADHAVCARQLTPPSVVVPCFCSRPVSASASLARSHLGPLAVAAAACVVRRRRLQGTATAVALPAPRLPFPLLPSSCHPLCLDRRTCSCSRLAACPLARSLATMFAPSRLLSVCALFNWLLPAYGEDRGGR